MRPESTVRMVNGQAVLDDPGARAVIRAIDEHNCRATLALHAERIAFFKRRIAERGQTPDEVLIVVLNVDDPQGGLLANTLMPGHDWQAYRDRGQVPYALGLAERPAIRDLIAVVNKEASDKLAALGGQAAVVVMDYGAIEVFEA